MKFSAFLLGSTLATTLAFGQAPPSPAKPPAPAAAKAAAATDDTVVLTVGTEKITKAQFERLVDALPDQQKQMVSTPDGKRRLAEQYGEMKTLVQEAKAKKLDQTPVMQSRLAMQTDQVLASAEYQELGNGKPSQAAVEKYYQDHLKEWENVKGRHILIRFKGSQVPLRLNQKDLTEEEALQKAKDLRAKILAGAKFSEVATAESDDTGSGANGGDLGEFSRGQMVPEFENAAFTQKVGEVGEPVKSAFGYHIILVEAHSNKSLADARAEIEGKLKPEIAQEGLEALKKKTPITLNDAYFGKP
jgi:peptidyl-prolyl cis-trans isomerase C